MSTKPIPINPKPKGLFQVVREKMRLALVSLFTEKTYIQWYSCLLLSTIANTAEKWKQMN